MAALALVDGVPKLATETGLRGTCIGIECGAPMISKVGTVVRGHWAHVANTSCDLDDTGEKGWHLTWRTLFYLRGAQTEIVMGRHRADIVLPDGRVIEFQTTFLPPADVASRETTFGEMAWIYLVTSEISEGHIAAEQMGLDGSFKFTWSTTRRSMLSHRRPVFWHWYSDRLEEIWQIESFTDAGDGTWTSRARIVAGDWEEFSRRIIEGEPFGEPPTFHGFGLGALRAVSAGQRLHVAPPMPASADTECDRHHSHRAHHASARVEVVADDLERRLNQMVDHLRQIHGDKEIRVVSPGRRPGWFVHVYDDEIGRIDARWVRPDDDS